MNEGRRFSWADTFGDARGVLTAASAVLVVEYLKKCKRVWSGRKGGMVSSDPCSRDPCPRGPLLVVVVAHVFLEVCVRPKSCASNGILKMGWYGRK